MYDVVTFRCEQRKLSEMTKHRQLCLAVFLLFLGSVASVVPSLHVVAGADYNFNGVYEERREPELRGPKSLNFPDGNFQRAKTFRTKCVNFPDYLETFQSIRKLS